MDTKQLQEMEARLVKELGRIGNEVLPSLEKRQAELDKIKATADSTAKEIRAAHEKWSKVEAELADVKKARDDAFVAQGKLQDQIKDLEKSIARRKDQSQTAAKAVRGRKDIQFRMAQLGLALSEDKDLSDYRQEASKGGGQIRFRRKIEREAMQRFSARHLRAFSLGSAELNALRDVVTLPAVLDPLRPPTLRDLMTVLPITGARTQYARETLYHSISEEILTGVTLPAATPTAIEVSTAAGFIVGSTVYADDAQTKSGVVTATDYTSDPNTVTVNSAGGFTVVAGDELWSETFGPTAAGAYKPEMKVEFTDQTLVTRTHAVTATVHRQELRDIARLNAILNGRMSSQLSMNEEGQLLNGDGVAPNLTGILNTAGINTLTQVDTILDVIRRSATLPTLFYHRPNAVIVHPTEFQEMELLKGNDDHYVFFQIQTSDMAVPMVWRLAIVETTAMPQGTGLVGDFMGGAAIVEREGMDFAMTDSHEDHFARNLLDLRVEMESGIEVWYPRAFTAITFL